MLDKADRLVLKGQYADALEAYEQILAKPPDADVALRARASREAVADVLTARAQLGRLTVGMKAQEADLVRLRDELSRARGEITRLTAETDRLRAELEQLKRIDIDLERRRK